MECDSEELSEAIYVPVGVVRLDNENESSYVYTATQFGTYVCK